MIDQVSKRNLQEAERLVLRWFAEQGRKAFPFQKQAWRAFLAGKHGLLHSPTGTGKTLAVFLGPIIQALSEMGRRESDPLPTRRAARKASSLRILWLTPLRALASDTEENLTQAVEQLGLPWYVEKRTGDSNSATRSRQRTAWPEILITTPESLSLMLTHADSRSRFGKLTAVVVDEWHELLGTKRGVQTELGLARVRSLCPTAKIWGLSATLGNITEAASTLFGSAPSESIEIIRSRAKKKIELQTVMPDCIERFPWAGHLGIRMAPAVVDFVRESQSVLVFTNTRAQTEYWYRTLLQLAPELAGVMAVHHGSLDQKLRWWVEDQLRLGKLKCCVCTSSLDLGVDFSTVDRVVQIGSPKGAARLLQRAGRSGHSPDADSFVKLIPTNTLELVEFAALKDAVAQGEIESRKPLLKPLDVLAQHVVTCAIGGGFASNELLQEVQTTRAYQDLTEDEWQWVIDFCERGGASLNAYPDYHRIVELDGCYAMLDKRQIRRHRMSIGTIASDTAIAVKYLKGRTIGTVEESFVARMSPGDQFMLGGRMVKLIRVHDNTAWVRKTTGTATAIPRWSGGRMPLSSQLSKLVRERLAAASEGKFVGIEMSTARPLLELQREWSSLPAIDELLVEQYKDRDGYHLFVYPFDGRLVHEGLAALVALRLSRVKPLTFTMAMNDYGFVLLSKSEIPFDSIIATKLFDTQNVSEDILGSLNASEMCKRQFRDVARVAGLIFSGFPDQKNTTKHLQASSNLFFEVFSQYDPSNLLLLQAKREVLHQQLQESRMVEALNRIKDCKLIVNQLRKPSPFAFQLMTDSLRDRMSSERFEDRVKRMVSSLEYEAGRVGV